MGESFRQGNLHLSIFYHFYLVNNISNPFFYGLFDQALRKELRKVAAELVILTIVHRSRIYDYGNLLFSSYLLSTLPSFLPVIITVTETRENNRGVFIA